jgi:hypothetical protein
VLEIIAYTEGRKLEHVELRFPTGLQFHSESFLSSGGKPLSEEQVKAMRETLKTTLRFLETHGIEIQYKLNGLKAFG